MTPFTVCKFWTRHQFIRLCVTTIPSHRGNIGPDRQTVRAAMVSEREDGEVGGRPALGLTPRHVSESKLFKPEDVTEEQLEWEEWDGKSSFLHHMVKSSHLAENELILIQTSSRRSQGLLQV